MKAILLSISALICSVAVHSQTTHEISWMMGISVEDASLTIETGDTIKWTWAEDEMPHDVSSVDPNAPEDFGSEIMSEIGSVYEYTFNDSVTFDYRCSVHAASMNGTITVESGMSVEDKFFKNLKYYPNPVRNHLTLTSLIPVQKLEVFTLGGTKVMTRIVENQNLMQLSFEALPQGVFFLKIHTANQTGVIKIVKN